MPTPTAASAASATAGGGLGGRPAAAMPATTELLRKLAVGLTLPVRSGGEEPKLTGGEVPNDEDALEAVRMCALSPGLKDEASAEERPSEPTDSRRPKPLEAVLGVVLGEEEEVECCAREERREWPLEEEMDAWAAWLDEEGPPRPGEGLELPALERERAREATLVRIWTVSLPR